MSLNESNAAAELERLIEPDTLNSTLLCSAPASSQRLEQIGLPEERNAKFIALARTLISEGVTRPEMLAEFLDKARPDRTLRKYSEGLWDLLGVADKSLRGTHDWHAIYAKLDKPKKSVAAKKPGQQRRPTTKKKAIEEVLASMNPIWRDVLRDKWDGMEISAIAEKRNITETAVVNVLRMAEGRLRILMNRAATKPTASTIEEPNPTLSPSSDSSQIGSSNEIVSAAKRELSCHQVRRNNPRLSALESHFKSSRFLQEMILPRIESKLNESTFKARKPTAVEIQEIDRLANEYDSWRWGCVKSITAYLGFAILIVVAPPVPIAAVATYIAWAHFREKRFLNSPEFKNALESATSAVLHELSQRESWSDMDWRTVELEVASLFVKLGYNAHATQASSDGGIDVIAIKNSVKTVIQCKQHETVIGSPDVVQLIGASKIQKADIAIMYSKSGFTSGARTTAENEGVVLWTLDDLDDLVALARKAHST